MDQDREMEEGITTDFRKKMSYGDYLGLDTLLTAAKPISPEHDEMLFITIHQVQELWIKLLLHELDLAIRCIRTDQLRQAFKAMARMGRIQRQLIEAWEVLATMTPRDYLAFRVHLGSSSGFQSWQYRALEFRLGEKSPDMLKPHAHRPDLVAKLQAVMAEPSLYDEALRLLARRGYPVPAEVLGHDLSRPYEPNAKVTEIWASIYASNDSEFDLYELAEELVDIEDAFQTWRFRHMRTVERIIGMAPGTGGSAGVPYLRRAIERRFFPELYEARTAMA